MRFSKGLVVPRATLRNVDPRATLRNVGPVVPRATLRNVDPVVPRATLLKCKKKKIQKNLFSRFFSAFFKVQKNTCARRPCGTLTKQRREKKVEEKISYPFILEESPRKALENIFFFIFSDFFVFFYMVRILKISIKYR